MKDKNSLQSQDCRAANGTRSRHWILFKSPVYVSGGIEMQSTAHEAEMLFWLSFNRFLRERVLSRMLGGGFVNNVTPYLLI